MKIAPAEEVRSSAPFHHFFRKQRKGGKGEGAGGAPSLGKGGAVGSGARPLRITERIF